jgi:hypothetical protein
LLSAFQAARPPEGRQDDSPRHRPGNQPKRIATALKGRNSCRTCDAIGAPQAEGPTAAGDGRAVANERLPPVRIKPHQADGAAGGVGNDQIVQAALFVGPT